MFNGDMRVGDDVSEFASSRSSDATDTHQQTRSSQPQKKKFQTCILHIGAEKTGTSALQLFFNANRNALKKDGVFYPSLGEGGSQWEFVAVAHPRTWVLVDVGRAFEIKDSEDRDQFVARFRSKFDKAIQQQADGCRHLLISSEHFHSRLASKKSMELLKQFLEPWVEEFKIVFYIRRQDRVAISYGSTQAKSGSVNVDAIFKDEVQRYFDFEAVYDLWADEFGREAIDCRVYEDFADEPHGLIKDFCSLVDVPVNGKKLSKQQVNQSLSRVGVRFLEEFNRQVPRELNGRVNPVSKEMAELVSELFPGKHYLIERRKAQTFLSHYQASNDRLKQKAFPDREGPLFDDDFSEYPESCDSDRLTTEEAVKVATAIMQYKKEGQPVHRSLMQRIADLVGLRT